MQNKKELYKIIIGVLFVFLIWSLVALVVGNDNLFPAPLVTIKRFLEIAQTPQFFNTVGMTLLRVLIGLTIALVSALLLGLLSVYSKFINTMFKPMVAVIKAMPNISIIVQLIIWLGPLRAPPAVGFFVVFPLLYTAVVEGLGNVDVQLTEMAEIYGVSKRHKITYIYLPCLGSYVSAAFAAAVGLNIKIMIGAEFISQTKNSIGDAIYLSRAYLDTAGVLAWSIVAILASLVLEIPARWLKRRIGHWKEVE